MKIGCHIFLINNKKEFLLQLRDNKLNISYPNFWGLLGGAKDIGETPYNTMYRELNEEIEYIPKKIILLGNKIIWQHRKKCLVHFFIGKMNKKIGEIKLHEGQKVEYFIYNKAINIHIIPFFRDYLIENKNILLRH